MEYKEFKRLGNHETSMIGSIKKQFDLSKESKLQLANLIIIISTFLATIIFIIVGYIYLGLNWTNNIKVPGVAPSDTDPSVHLSNWLYIFLIPASSLAAYAGIAAAIASNHKSPIKYLILSLIAVFYRMTFVLAQYITQPGSGGGGIKSIALIGQPVLLFIIIRQALMWSNLNKKSDTGKFKSQAFKGERTFTAWIIIFLIFIGLVMFSVIFNHKNSIASVFVDVGGSTLYMIAINLSSFGNILCFPIFFISNLQWVYWGWVGIFQNKDPLMIIFSITTFIETFGLNALLITGFIQWYMDDFTWVKGKGPMQKRTIESNIELENI